MTRMQEPTGLPARAGRRRPAIRRPSPAIAISLVALFFAMSGTAYAATGGDFLLGKSNTATALTSLSNTKGTALSLSSTATTPPLKVSNSVQVPGLNASQLDGIPASGFVAGTGTASSGQAIDIGGGGNAIATTPGSTLTGQCDVDGGTGADIFLTLDTGSSASWWNYNGVSNTPAGTSAQVTPESTSDFMVIVQVTNNSKTIATYTASQTYDASGNICYFTAQVVLTKNS